VRTKQWVAGAMALAAGLVCSRHVWAEDWLTRPVTMIVPYAPGGLACRASPEPSAAFSLSFVVAGLDPAIHGESLRMHP